MARRTGVVLGGGGGGGHHGHDEAHGAPQGTTVFSVDAIASKASKPLERSPYQYKGSEKGGEVGARNEAAFIPYQEHKPENLKERYAMPDYVNLMTVMPVLLTTAFVIGASWGTFLWDVYCRRHYKTVIIERPQTH
jgi:hypothetical protein